MRIGLVLCFACAGCDVLFQLDHVPMNGDGGLGSDGGGSDGGGGSDTPNFVFVTSTQVAPGTLGGVAGGDALCTKLAMDAGLPGHYVAWLSSSTASAAVHLGAFARGWVRVDGKPFADTAVDIVQNRVWYPLRITEHGDDVALSGQPGDLVVSTGTDLNGSTSIYTCNDYTDPSPGIQSGLADDAPYGWDTNMGGSCGTPARLYCFGIDHRAPVTIVPESARLAFVTQNDFNVGAGITTLDQACAREARDAQLPGTYLAAVATTTQAALARFTPGAPWVRPDGTTVVAESGAILAPIEQNAGGGQEFPNVAWSGATTLTTPAPTLAASCDDWLQTTSSQGLTGNLTRSGPEAFGGLANTCNAPKRVYCLQD